MTLIFRRHSSPPDLRNGQLVDKDSLERREDTWKDVRKDDDFRMTAIDANGNFVEEDEDRWRTSDDITDGMQPPTQGCRSDENTSSFSGERTSHFANYDPTV